MSDNDVLLSDFMKLVRQLEQYIEEYDPNGGDIAMSHLKQAMVAATRFTDEEKQ